jgi:hypothetical protein
LQREEAGQLLAAAIHSDRGRDLELTRTLVFLTRDHELASPVLGAIEEALRDELPPIQRSRLLDAREGLRR